MNLEVNKILPIKEVTITHLPIKNFQNNNLKTHKKSQLIVGFSFYNVFFGIYGINVEFFTSKLDFAVYVFP